MKLRSAILFGCLLFVPLSAMFSHKVPRGFREGFRERFWRPVVDRLTAGGSTEPDAGAAASGGGSAAADSVKSPPAPAVAAERVAVPEPPATDPVPAPTPIPTVTLRSTPLEQPSRASLDERLKSLGVVGLQVKALEGDFGVHVASCRVPVDAGGQLQRLFQANGPTPEASLERLVSQIEAWRSRIASRPAQAVAPGGPDEPAAAAAGRFR